MNPRLTIPATAALYIVAVVLANLLTDRYGLVPVLGTPLLVTAGTYAAGAALLARDLLQRAARPHLGVTGAFLLAAGAVLAAAALSAVTADPALALASGIAFLAAETVDLLIFTPLQERAGFVPAALASNTVSAPIDTVLFLAIAGFPLTAEAVGGQFVAKVLWATAVPLALWWALRRLAR